MDKLLLLSLTILFLNCNGTRNTAQTEEATQRQQGKEVIKGSAGESVEEQPITIKQGIVGKVLWEAGNQMPSPDAPQGSSKRGIQREVHIYRLTNSSQVTTTDGVFYSNIRTPLVSKVTTDAEGNFSVILEPGFYSLFTKEEKGLFANLFDGENNIFPVEVKTDQVTTVDFVVNYNAAY